MVLENLHVKRKIAADLQDPPDEPGAEMVKEARVWRDYVRETDRWDREMVEGRNSSLDVLMLFATLFSAISTAFVVLSLSDLKPDYAKESAQTLLTVSQTLVAIANNYSAPLPAQTVPGTASFSPPRSAVVVNVLLLLSLSLSVVVSLTAMLGKEWCYNFMSGRSGQIYEQARRRQKRWNGIELWKMREVLTYLPGVMHLALLLFATGLSVYLWNINVGVAVPVILMTGLATLLYITVTLLPVVDRFCPYSTPSTAMLEQSARALSKLVQTGTFRIASYLFRKANCPQWLKSTSHTMYRSLRSRDYDSIPDGPSDTGVPMDPVRSEMLAWLLTNCEDPQSISTALQAIAGARPDLLHAPLAQCGVYELVVSRLNAYTRIDPSSEQYRVKDISTLPTALGYCRSYSALISGDAYECPWDNWKVEAAKPKIVKGDLEDLQMIKVHLDLLDQANKTGCDFNTLATGTAAAMRYCHWAETRTSNPAPRHIAPELAESILSEHLQGARRVLSMAALHTLVESTAHYLTALWTEERRQNPRSLLTLRLAQVYLASYATAPDIAVAATVALAAAAFSANSYPGGERLPPSAKGRETRGVQVLQYYQANKPTNRTASSLFAFGFAGLLSSLDFKSLAAEATLMPSLLAAAAGHISQYVWSGEEVNIHTLPPSAPLADYLTTSACRSLLSVAHHSFDHVNEPAIGIVYSNFMPQNLGITCTDYRLYIAALKALCYAQSNDLHKLCFKTLDAQPIPVDLSQPLVKALKDDNILERLCDTSLSNATTPIVAAATTLHFKLLIATIVLSTDYQLEDRQSLLRPILRCRHEFAGLKPSALDHSLPGNESLLSHIQQDSPGEPSIQQTMLRTMQYVVDFCHADPKLNPSASTNSSGGQGTLDWRAKLQEIKNTHRLGSQTIGPLNVEPPNFIPTSFGSQGAGVPNDGGPNTIYSADARISNQMGWRSFNDSQPTPQPMLNTDAPRAGLLNANPPHTNYAGPNLWHPPTQTPDQSDTPYARMPEPDHYQSGPVPVTPSFGGPQASRPNPHYPYPARPNQHPPAPVRPRHRNVYAEPYRPAQNSAPNVPALWQHLNRPENDSQPGHITMPRSEGYLHDLNDYSPNSGFSESRKNWGAEPPTSTEMPRERPVQNFELQGANLQGDNGGSPKYGDSGPSRRGNVPLPPNDNARLLDPPPTLAHKTDAACDQFQGQCTCTVCVKRTRTFERSMYY